MIRTLTLLLILQWGTSAASQSTLDSLNLAYQSTSDDSIKVFVLGEMVVATYRYNPDTAIRLCKEGLALAEKENLAGAKAECFGWLGYLLKHKGDINLALEYNHKALEIQEKIVREKSLDGKNPLSEEDLRLNQIAVATLLNNIGVIHEQKSEMYKALEYANRCLSIKQEIEDWAGVASSLNNIGLIYKLQGDIPKALDYYHQSLKLDEKYDNPRGQSTSLNNIGLIYKNQGDTLKALEYYRKGMKIDEEANDLRGLAASLRNVAGIYALSGSYAQALRYYRKSLRLTEEVGHKTGMAMSLHHIGGILCRVDSIKAGMSLLRKSIKISTELENAQWVGLTTDALADWYIKTDKVDSAQYYAEVALNLAREINLPVNIGRASNTLTKVYRLQEKWKKALAMYELHIEMRDSINNEKTQKATIRQQTKYEFEKAMLVKEQEELEADRVAAEATSRRDNLQYSMILIAILVLFGAVLGLGFVKVSTRMAEGIIFFSFLILFEFLLVLADPYIETWSGGAPGIKLLFNAGIAALIFPLHSLFEVKLKGRLARQ